MKVLKYIAVALTLAMLVGCSHMRAIAVDPSYKGNVVVQVDSMESVIINDSTGNVNVVNGEHRVKIYNRAQLVLDSTIFVSDVNGIQHFLLSVIGVAGTAGLTVISWPLGIFFVPSVIVLPIMMLPDKSTIVVYGNNIKETSPKLYYFGASSLIHFRNPPQNLKMENLDSMKNVGQTSGMCYDETTDVIWFKSAADSNFYALRRGDIEVCSVDDSSESDEDLKNKYSCNAFSDNMLKKMLCNF